MKDKDFLIDYLEHISYEIEGLISSYLQMSKLEERSITHPLGKQGQQNDCLDLMALHFRNLYEFFCYPPLNGYIRAVDYAPNFSADANSRLIDKANNQVSHLTKKRHAIALNSEEKPWDPNEVMKWVINQINKWELSLGEDYVVEFKKRSALMKTFIDWYKEEIKKGNA